MSRLWSGPVTSGHQQASLAVLSDAVIDIVAEHAYGATSPRSYAAVFHMGGAVARVPRGATAYPERDVGHNMSIDAVWLPRRDREGGADRRAAKNAAAPIDPSREVTSRAEGPVMC